MNGIRPRWFVRNLESALRVLPVTVVTGARQTGKTTLVKSLGPSRAFFTLDDVGVLDQAEPNDRFGTTLAIRNVGNGGTGGSLDTASAISRRTTPCGPAAPK